MCQQMGELSAKEGDHDEAVMHYEKATDLYQSDVGSATSFTSCWLVSVASCAYSIPLSTSVLQIE